MKDKSIDILIIEFGSAILGANKGLATAIHNEISTRFSALEAEVKRLTADLESFKEEMDSPDDIKELKRVIAQYQGIAIENNQLKQEVKRLTEAEDLASRCSAQHLQRLYEMADEIITMREEIKRLTEERDNLKCCGNCLQLRDTGEVLTCKLKLWPYSYTRPTKCCGNWQSDSMTKR